MGQGWQRVCAAFAKVPAAQDMQAEAESAPSPSLTRPVGQAMHCVRFGAANFPATHGVHCSRPSSSVTLPASQSAHALEFTIVWVPAGHVDAVNSQEEDPATLNFPPSQAMHADASVCPVCALYRPASQDVQPDARPAISLNRPASQSSHAERSTLLNFPALHSRQERIEA